MPVLELTFKFTFVNIHSLDIIEGVYFFLATVFLNYLDKKYTSGKIHNLNREHTIDNNNCFD
ncbi:hypothetical protein Metho_0365 [Methanomethylovorans hollandica DSM 15978]|uniref:Uncharacterized protein n=1 Tax=Methanomethylovorans hollandica (strain DSM 15978 / NBRC 107637 / DMS1) TaxID=867904 RepID=L0KX36_METHD|nr:hypothetical protein Metho_0365 [Methanomethylovorans hollandica DSM 15978]